MHKYGNIINLVYIKSKKYKHMSIMSRASQFAPFAALSGYGDEIEEASRLTNDRIYLDDDSKILINEKLKLIKGKIKDRPFVEVIYFLPDDRKCGGNYRKIKNYVKKIDEVYKRLIFADNKMINIEDIVNIIVYKS